MAPWNAAEMQASLWPGSGSEVSSKYFNTYRELFIGEYRGSSTRTWHSLYADTDILSTKWSSTISAAITITVTVSAHLSLAHKACCVHDIQMNNVDSMLMLIHELIQVQNLSTPYTVNTFHMYMLEYYNNCLINTQFSVH